MGRNTLARIEGAEEPPSCLTGTLRPKATIYVLMGIMSRWKSLKFYYSLV